MKTETRILIVEHDQNDIELIEHQLKKDGINYLAEIVQNEAEYRNALKNFIPDIILSDYKLPAFHGLVAFEIREELAPLTPIFFVSGTIGEENSIELIKNGLTDFVLKDKLYSLSTKVERALNEAKVHRQKIEVDDKLAFEYKEKEKQLAAIMIANSDLKKAEEKIVKANRLYYVVSQINQLIVRTTDKQILFKEICNIVINLGKFRMAWIGVVDEKTKKVIPAAHAGEENGYLSEIKDISVDDVPEGRGPAGIAFREGEYCVCNDIEKKPNMTPWKTEAFSHGYFSCIALPIKTSGKVVALFSLYAAEPNFFDDKEIALLKEITGDISFALENFEKEERRTKAEAALRESEDTFRRLFNESADPILLLDDTGFTDCNQSAVSILGYSSVQDVINKKPWDISPEKQPDGMLSSGKAKEMIAKASKQGHNRFEWIHIKADGTEFPVEVMLTVITLKGKKLFYTLWRDITERKIAEQSLIDLSNRLLMATNSEGTGIFDWDIQKDILNWDDNMYKIFGVSPDKFNGSFEAWSNTVHPDDLQESIAEVQALIDGTKDFHTLFRILWPGNEVRHIEGHAIIMRDGNGKAYRMIGVNRDITEQKRIEEAVIKERDLSDSIINSLPGIFYLLDEKGKNLRWNKNFEKVTGYSAAEINQLHALDLFEADEKQILKEKIAEVFKSGRAEVETHLFTKTKEKIPYYLEGSRIIFEGNPCLIGVGTDITERRRSEEVLRLTQFVFDHAGDSIFWTAPDSRIVNVNEAACLSLGYTRQEMLELSVPDIDPEHTKEVWSFSFRELRENGSHFFESIQRARDGHLIPVEIRANYIKFGDKELTCAFARDITERKKAEEILKQSETRFRDLFENANEAIVVVDIETLHFKNYNSNAIKLMKYSPEEILKMGPLDISPEFQPDGRSSAEKSMEYSMSAMAGGKPVVEWLIIDANGKEIMCELRVVLLSSDDSPQFLTSFIDITKRKNAEKKIEQQNKELAISNTELEQFAYIASHDLQEPLRMVSSFLQLLEKKYKGQLDETAEQYINFAVDGAGRMKALIQALLMYSRIGNKKADFTRVDLNDIAVYVTNVIEEEIKKNQAVITVSPLPVITANNSLISQLLLNLTTNALKYRGETKPRINIGFSEDNSYYTIFVKDNGIGIDRKFFDKIFVIFQRLHNKDEYSGTGIGLAICKKIVEIHKGKIWVESEVGKGTTFYFSIPKTKQSA